MNQAKVMLLIDADNVSIDVIEQTVHHLIAEFGALHGRRAYCNAESALKHQNTFKRLGIRPMVNLAAGKNSTDIALAVDAVELVMRERPDVLAIASSDSDFAPLVTRVREKGCRVLGFGQDGKTGDSTVALYDRFVQFSSKGVLVDPDAPPTRRAPAKRAPAKKAAVAKSAPAAAAPATKDAAAKKTGRGKAGVALAAEAPPASQGASPTPVAKAPKQPKAPTPAKPQVARNKPSVASQVAQVVARVMADAVGFTAPEPATTPSPNLPPSGDVARILAAAPELRDGQWHELNEVALHLRGAGMLGKNQSSTKLLGKHPEHFELAPSSQPNKVRQRP